MTRSELFFNFLYNKMDKSKQRLDKYLENPTEENIHDLRTSIRRLETAYSIVPKSCGIG